MYHRFRSEVDFLTIYQEEAHTLDEMTFGEENPWEVNTPHTLQERLERAVYWVNEAHHESPYVVDLMDDNCQKAYYSFPDKFIVIDEDGKILSTSTVASYYQDLEKLEIMLLKRFPH